MKKVLRRKSHATNADFVAAWETVPSFISEDEVDLYFDNTVLEIKREVAGRKVAYGWSGGKDSLVLALLCEAAGVRAGVHCIVGQLEFPAFLRWCETHRPAYLEVEDNAELGLSFLQEAPRYLFPRNSTDGYFWTRNGTHRGQRLYYQRHNLDMMLYGRTRGDGNYIRGRLHTNQQGLVQYSPMRDWPLEAVLGLLYYRQVSLPPLYGWPDGWKTGTGPWCGRQGYATKEDGWAATYQIDPLVVLRAAQKIDSAYEWVQTNVL